MEEIGVKAVVSQLASFMKNMNKMDSSIQSIIPTSKLLGGAFDWLSGIVSNFVGGAARTLEYVLGGLIKDAIEAVINAIKDLVKETIQAGQEFQMLEIRLNGLNLPAGRDEINDWTLAMSRASAQTKEQLDWIIALSAATPFDATDVSTIYTMARGYGMADAAAKRLTTAVINFSAGMGLSKDKIVNVMAALGQMDQRGKITGTAIRSLVQSAFLPLDDVLQRVADMMGISKKALAALQVTAEGVPADLFITAFEQMVEEEPRFVGAAGRMGRTFEAAVNNVKEMFRSVLGLRVLTPIFDVLGSHVSSLVDNFISFNAQGDLIKTEKWTELQVAAERLGTAISGIINMLLNVFLPNTNNIADGMITSLNGISTWLEENGPEINVWALEVRKNFKEKVLPAIENVWKLLFGSDGKDGAIQRFGKWLNEKLIPAIQKAGVWISTNLLPYLSLLAPIFAELIPLGDAVGAVIAEMFGGENATPGSSFAEFVNNVLIPGIKDLTKWINDNKENIAKWIGYFLKGLYYVTLLGMGISVLVGIIGEIIASITGWILANQAVQVILAIVAVVLLSLAASAYAVPIAIAAIVVAIIALIAWLWNSRDAIGAWATETWDNIKQWAEDTYFKITWFEVQAGAKLREWAVNTANAIRNWVLNGVDEIKKWATNSNDSIKNFSSNALGTIAKFGIDFILKIISTFGTVYNEMDIKMGQIAKMLLAKAQGWVTQIVTGFSGRAQEIIDALNELIADIQENISDIIIGVVVNSPGTGTTGGESTGGGGNSGGGAGGGGGGAMPTFAGGGGGGMVSEPRSASTSIQNQNSYNLTIVSSAPVEPIIQDFSMLTSLQGG